MSSFKNYWNKFVSQNPAGSFLQSYDWGVFQEHVGQAPYFIVVTERKVFSTDLHKIKRYTSRISKGWLFVALVLVYRLPFGKTYLYAPRGPIVDFLAFGNKKPLVLFQEFLKEVAKIARKEHAIFFRMDPEWLGSEEVKKFVRGLNMQESFKEVQPRETIILDLMKNEDRLLEGMHPKTRYNIRLAERKGVRCQVSGVKDKNFDAVWKLFQETAKRDQFHLHQREYYERMLQIDGRFTDGRLTVGLFTAEYKNKILAANIIAFFGGRATYLHGASSQEHRNVMAPFLLHWEVIREAKRRGCTEYDLWGISEKKWPGVTRFKRGFGGSEVEYIGTYDYIFDDFWYNLYKLGQKVRRSIP